MLGLDHLRAAPADVDDQQPLMPMRPLRLDAQVDQPRLLLTRDQLDRLSHDGAGAFQEHGLIAGIAHGGCGHDARGQHVERFVEAGHPLQRLQSHGHRRLIHLPIAEDALAQARHLPVLGQHTQRRARFQLRRQHADRIAADVDRRVSGHRAPILAVGSRTLDSVAGVCPVFAPGACAIGLILCSLTGLAHRPWR